jgi:biotin carboxyl carrier protein
MAYAARFVLHCGRHRYSPHVIAPESVMRYISTVAGRQHTIALDENGPVRCIVLDGRELTINWQHVGLTRQPAIPSGDQPASQQSIVAGSHSYDVYILPLARGPDGGTGRLMEVHIDGLPYVVAVQDERSESFEQLAGGAHVSDDVVIRAPMPGLVSSVLADIGDEVRRGQTVVVLEAMKMENDLPTPRAGVVKAVHVTRGQAVNQHDALAVVGDPPGTSGATEPGEVDE